MLCMHINQITYNLSITKLTRVPIFNLRFIRYKEFHQISIEYLYLFNGLSALLKNGDEIFKAHVLWYAKPRILGILIS